MQTPDMLKHAKNGVTLNVNCNNVTFGFVKNSNNVLVLYLFSVTNMILQQLEWFQGTKVQLWRLQYFVYTSH